MHKVNRKERGDRMTYSFKVRIGDEEEVDLHSLPKEKQDLVGQAVFRTMLEHAGMCRGKKVLEETKEVDYAKK